jgi:CTP synthase (UTP-ammonia lyase)
VTGGVVSSLGKGLTSASIGMLLEGRDHAAHQRSAAACLPLQS